MRRLLDEETRARTAAEDVFGEQVLAAAELPDLVRRFTEQHRGITARFSGQYKADRQAAALLTWSGCGTRACPHAWTMRSRGRRPQPRWPGL